MNNFETADRIVTVGVDIQNDFCPGGSLAVVEGDLVVPAINHLSSWTRAHRGTVAFTRDWHPAVTNHFGNPPNFATSWPVHCVADTYGAMFKAGLDVQDGDPVFDKGMVPDEDAYSGFQGRTHAGLTLETLIRPDKHERVAVDIGGLATDYCIRATAKDAALLAAEWREQERFLDVYLVTDAVRAVNPANEQAVFDELTDLGVRLTTTYDMTNNRVVRIGE